MSIWHLLPEGSELLAKDETALWQGRPRTADLALRLLHLRAISAYFLILAVWNFLSVRSDGGHAADIVPAGLWVLVPALACAAVLYAIAFVLAATSHYMITDKRIIMQIGVALPIAVSLPLNKIASADMKLYPNGSGDITVSFTTEDQIAYLLLWPHARPRFYKKPQPMLRSISDAAGVAAVLAKALATASGQQIPAQTAADAPQTGTSRGHAGQGMAVA